MTKKTRYIAIALGIAVFLLLGFRLCFGIFVIQPMGAIPEGATIVYWRIGMNTPFIASADGLLEESGMGVSILGRGMMLAKLAQPIRDREVFRCGYSERLYLWSTNGKKYER